MAYFLDKILPLKVRGVAGSASRLLPSRLSGRNDEENPFSTHIPILIGLARLLKVKRVLEFGCGQYSTLTFLNRTAFPDLVELRSYETESDWMNKIALLVGDDPRVCMSLVHDRMDTIVDGISFKNFDLILIDDSANAEERTQTIRHVVQACYSSNVLIIHDYEMKVYRKATSLPNRYRFAAFKPNTGIAWDKAILNKPKLRRLDFLIKRYANSIKPDNLSKWIQIIDYEQWE